MTLDQIKSYYQQGLYDNLESEFDTLSSQLSDEDKIKAIIYRSWAEERRGNYLLAEELGKSALERSFQLNNDELKMGAYSALAYSQWRQDKSDDLKKCIKKGKEIANNIGEDRLSDLGVYYLSYLLHVETLNMWQEHDFQNAEETTLYALKLKERIDDKYGIANLLGNLSNYYFLIGDLQKAEDCGLEALSIYSNLNYLLGLAFAYNSLSVIKYERGDFDESIELQKQSLQISRKYGNVEFHSFTLYLIIFKLVNMRRFEEAKVYLGELENLAAQSEDEMISFDLRSAKALYLINQPNMKSKVDAMRLFEVLIEGPSLPNRPYKAYLRIQLCYGLVEELLLYGSESTLEEINYHIDEILYGSEKFLIDPYLESFILKSRIYLIQGELDEAEAILDKGSDLAQQKGMIRSVERMEDEKKSLQRQLNEWASNLEKNLSLKERAHMSKIQDYIKKAMSEVSKHR